MRYISKYPRMTLLRNSGFPAYEFEQGYIIVGKPTLNDVAGGNAIAAAPIINNFEGSMQLLFPDGATDLERVGLGRIFWEAPPIASGSGTIAANTRYEVISGETIYDGTTYRQGEVFVGRTGVTATSGVGEYALAVPGAHEVIGATQYYNEAFKQNHLLEGDEATFSIQGPQSVHPRPIEYVRP